MPTRTSLSATLANTIARRRATARRKLTRILKGDEKFAAEVAGYLADIVAEIMLRAGTLADYRSEGVAARFVDGLFRDTKRPAHIREDVELELAEHLVADIDNMGTRCLHLAPLVLKHRPNERVRDYLARLSRCYVAGFFPESLIMCRASLQNAVKDRYARLHIQPPRPRSDRFEATFSELLADAVSRGWLTESDTREAKDVWHRGSKAAHDDLYATKDILGTIETTLRLLALLGR